MTNKLSPVLSAGTYYCEYEGCNVRQDNESVKACKDMADVCELAHKRTVRDCKKLNISADCSGRINSCNHSTEETHYGNTAQQIFDRHYDHIISVTGL